DSFQYVYQTYSGDGQIVARVASVQNTNVYAKAGVMLRAGLGAGAADVILDVKPGGGIEFMSRAVSGGSTTFIAGAAHAAPVWLKLTRSGATVSGFVSGDGSAWTLVGSTSVTMASTAYLGLAVTSHDTTLLNKSTFDGVSVGVVVTGGTPPGSPTSPNPVSGS